MNRYATDAYRKMNRARMRRARGLDVSDEEEQALFELQGGLCYICDRPLPANAHLDHDKLTGEPRGLCCSGCNRGVGLFRDDPALLRQAADVWRIRSGGGSRTGNRTAALFDGGAAIEAP